MKGESVLLMPVLIEGVMETVEKMEGLEEIDGLMLFGGQTVGVAAKYDIVRELKEKVAERTKRDDFVIGMHQNITPGKSNDDNS